MHQLLIVFAITGIGGSTLILAYLPSAGSASPCAALTVPLRLALLGDLILTHQFRFGCGLGFAFIPIQLQRSWHALSVSYFFALIQFTGKLWGRCCCVDHGFLFWRSFFAASLGSTDLALPYCHFCCANHSSCFWRAQLCRVIWLDKPLPAGATAAVLITASIFKGLIADALGDSAILQ